jgi:hypothetical protein
MTIQINQANSDQKVLDNYLDKWSRKKKRERENSLELTTVEGTDLASISMSGRSKKKKIRDRYN